MVKTYRHRESEMQMQCVRWFAYQYPYMRMLLYHPKNEGTANGRVRGAIAKAEGVVAGVADLILQAPTTDGYSCLAIEMKTEKGIQSPQQKLFERYIVIAGGQYAIIRSFEGFKTIVNQYVANIHPGIITDLKNMYEAQRKAEDEMARERMRKLINSNK